MRYWVCDSIVPSQVLVHFLFLVCMVWGLYPRFSSEVFPHMMKGLVPLVCWDGTICKMSLFLQYWHYCWYLFPRQLDQGSIFSKKCWDSCQPFGFSPAKCWVWFKIPMSLTSFYNVDFLIPQEGYPRASFVGISLHDMKTQSKIPQWRLRLFDISLFSPCMLSWTHLWSISLSAVLAIGLICPIIRQGQCFI